MQRIGPYEIVEKVGSGGMATVYKAYHAKLDRNVAIKVMHQVYAADSNFLARFEREARVVARLDHPHIVPIYDYNIHEGQPYLVMKFVPGKTLKQVNNEEALSLDEIRRILGSVADALTYAHGEGILHRDIKPSNILLDERNQPYLTDFGLARIVLSGESTLSADVMLGTPHYISPEQAQGLPDIDGRADVYSLGIVLYEQVTGSVPFTGDTPFAIVHKHLNAAPPLPSALNPELPPQVDTVLQRALEKEPAKRYNSPTALMQAFELAISESGLKHLDESRVSIAAERVPQISDHTPGGSKYVSIPSPMTGTVTTASSLQELMQQVGNRVRMIADEVRHEFAEGEVIQQITEGVRGVAQEVKTAIDQSGINENSENARRLKALKVINEDWGTDAESIRRRATKRMEQERGLFIHALVFIVVIGFMYATQGQAQTGMLEVFTNPESEFVLETGVDFLGPLASLNYTLAIAMIWGSGLISHILSVFYQTGARLTRQRETLRRTLEMYYGPYWPENIDVRDYKRIRRRVKDRYSNRAGFLSHAAAWVMLTIMAFAIWPPIWEVLLAWPAVSNDLFFVAQEATVPVLFSVLMGVSLLLHGIGLIVGMIVGGEAQERTLQREINREHELLERTGTIKRKHEELNDLMDDEKDKRYADESSPVVRMTGDGEFTDSFVSELEEARRKRDQ